eukprot:3933692-Rhodomonas_salina.2
MPGSTMPLVSTGHRIAKYYKDALGQYQTSHSKVLHGCPSQYRTWQSKCVGHAVGSYQFLRPRAFSAETQAAFHDLTRPECIVC